MWDQEEPGHRGRQEAVGGKAEASGMRVNTTDCNSNLRPLRDVGQMRDVMQVTFKKQFAGWTRE